MRPERIELEDILSVRRPSSPFSISKYGVYIWEMGRN